MTDDCLGPGGVERLFDLQALRTGHRHGFFERDQSGARVDANLDEPQPQVRQRAKAEYIRPQLLGQLSGIGALFWIAQFCCGFIEPLAVDVADAGDAEPGIRVESRAMVHAAFTHTDDDDRILFHFSALSHSIAFATT